MNEASSGFCGFKKHNLSQLPALLLTTTRYSFVFSASPALISALANFDATAPIQQPSVPGSTQVLSVAPAEGAACQRRIIMNSINARLFAIDADSGEFCADFGDGGQVDMPGGVIRGFDVAIGAMRWAFDPGRVADAGWRAGPL